MNEQNVLAKIEALEHQLTKLKNAHKEEYNTDAVYNTKETYGYSQIIESSGGTTLYISGMTPWDKNLSLPDKTLVGQVDHAFGNLKKLLASKSLTFDCLVSLRCYIAQENYYAQMEEALKVVHKYFSRDIKCAFTLIGVTGLAQPEQLVEIEAIAIY